MSFEVLSLVKGLQMPQRELTTADTSSPAAIVGQPEDAPTLLDALQLYLGQRVRVARKHFG